jgi:hypothetical protein
LAKPTKAETTAGMGTPEALLETAAVYEHFLEDLDVA